VNKEEEMQGRWLSFYLVLVLSVTTSSITVCGEGDRGFIDQWLVLGVFPYEEGQERLSVDFLGGEHDVIPYDGAVTSGLQWRKMVADQQGRIDFISQGDFGDTEYSVCYAHAFINSPVETNAYLLVGSDDAVRIYVNGIDVHYHEIPRGWRPDQDTVLVRLGIGWNRLMTKVANGVGDFALSARLVNEHFEPVQDIQFQSDNPAGRGAFEMISVSPHLRIMETGFAGFTLKGRDLRLELFTDILNLGTEKPAEAVVRLQGAFGEAKDYQVKRFPFERVVFQFDRKEIEHLARGDKHLTVELAWNGNIEKQTVLFDPWDALRLFFRGVDLRGWAYRQGHVAAGSVDVLDSEGWEPYVPVQGVERTRGETTLVNRFSVPPELVGFPLELSIPEEYENARIWIDGEERGTTKSDLLLQASAVKSRDRFVFLLVDSLVHEQIFQAKIIPRHSAFVSLSDDAYWVAVFTEDRVSLGQDTEAQLLILALREDKSEFVSLVDREARRFNGLSPHIKENTIDVIGNAHIDMAWLWPWSETVDVCRVTFERALENMERYPDFLYAQSQARAYAWMEERYPELFEEIKRRVGEGRWIIVGGTWVEPDNNLPSGESQVRQILYGKRYFKEKFGIDVNIGWIPDSFGYAWTLPQIYRKAGFKYFVTQKLTWNDTNEFPHKVFYWQGPDGSQLYCYFPYTYTHDLGPGRLADQFLDYHERTGLKDQLVLYGTGDHGGGPSEQMIDRVQTLNSVNTFPTVRQASPQIFLDNLEKETVDLPVWNDELYLEYHRGCYTTQALIKKRNRRCEVLLETAEKFASFSQLTYPADELENAWKKTLFNQFHDILPGSCIQEVVADAHTDYDWIEETANGVLDRSLRDISARIDTRGEGTPVVVWNPLSWSREDLVEMVLPQSLKNISTVTDERGVHVPFQMLEDTLVFLAEVPSLGYRIYRIQQAEYPQWAARFHYGHDHIENDYYRIDIDTTTGNWTRLFDKKHDREVLGPGQEGNVLQAFEDIPQAWDAWNIGYTGKRWNIEDVDGIEVMERGPLRVRVRITRTFGKSRFAQDIILYAFLPRIDVRNQIDWHEDHVLVKVAFPVNVRSDVATYEIPYGTIERRTIPDTPQDSAKFEVSAHKWIDLSDGTYGVGLLNDGKYGHDVRGNMMRITLLRSPKWPDPEADMGHHSFTYCLYPHAGDWRQAQTFRRGYELNYPLLAVIESPHKGDLPPQGSFASIEPENVILSVVKKGEDSENLMVRFYELFGMEARAEIILPYSVRSAHETDLMENVIAELQVEGNRIIVPTRPYEIKTVAIR
jgi:alpha-mannosidase